MNLRSQLRAFLLDTLRNAGRNLRVTQPKFQMLRCLTAYLELLDNCVTYPFNFGIKCENVKGTLCRRVRKRIHQRTELFSMLKCLFGL
jgi:hypothetical protein